MSEVQKFMEMQDFQEVMPLPELGLAYQAIAQPPNTQDVYDAWSTMNQQTMQPEIALGRLPNHVAAIMDGNGRWAEQRGLPRAVGHRQGVITVKNILRCCKDLGIKYFTVYAFSTENWRRPREEVGFLMRLFERMIRRELEQMEREGVRIRFVGDLNPLPVSLRSAIEKAMVATANNRAVNFTVAINYGGRHEIVSACQKVVELAQAQNLSPTAITEELFEQHLYTSEIGNPDLLIRTSGEMRLSNFLLWQLAYTEIYFTEALWPEFDLTQFYRALISFQKRDRRFGKV
ncbi:Undecaprenyl pyrophosphate synthase [Thalassoporum mexicanum PCC 7367]|uniref:isoprenyl transferase n=1 Tax=Thalassoporum mexicanum TaxID=3457544 RepID=UPI00029FD35A|nr:isoprenyl transferase [Pseudanabaena sp. PCC 7367]AFY69342.1 Undecaprenyl pyrophosphate synthase [Pseudanabaena sp. PCC 7367]